VPQDDYRAFLETCGLPLSGPGPIVLPTAGRWAPIRACGGTPVGQRRGLGVAYTEPLYVLAKDAAANALVVGPKPALSASDCRTGPANFLVAPADWPEAVAVQTCYRMRPRPAAGPRDGGRRLDIRFAEPVARPTPGQVAAVSDAGGRMLAGASSPKRRFAPTV